jgi:hypothetical protein
MKIYLDPKAFSMLMELKRNEGIDVNDLVSELIVKYSQLAEWEQPKHKCDNCSMVYFSEENLRQHIKRKHSAERAEASK